MMRAGGFARNAEKALSRSSSLWTSITSSWTRSSLAEISLASHSWARSGLQTAPKFEFSSLHQAGEFELSGSLAALLASVDSRPPPSKLG